MWFLGGNDVEKLEDSGNVKGLIRCLSSNEIEIRKNAADALGRLQAEQAVEPLFYLLEDIDIDVRKSSLIALIKIGEASIKQLVEGLAHNDDDVKNYCEQALKKLGEKYVDTLILWYAKSLGNPKARIANALGESKNEKAIKPLVISLRDDFAEVQKSAISALIKIGEPAVKILINSLDDEDGNIRLQSAKALSMMGDSAVKPLIDALKDTKVTVACSAAETLGKLKNNSAVPALIDALKNGELDLRVSAAEALGEIGDKRAVSALTEALNDTGYNVSNFASKALEKINSD